MTTVRLGIVQMSMSPDVASNRERAQGFVAEAAASGAQIVCLPELFSTPYFCRVEAPTTGYAESIPGPTAEMLSKTAQRHGIYLVGGSLYEQTNSGQLFNTTLVCAPDGSLLGRYRKMHIPHDPGFWEQNYFAPGDLGFQVFDTPLVKFGTLICYDQWFPEAARANALLGAQILFYPTAIGTLDGVPQEEGPWQEAWENAMRGHAIANSLVVVGVNRVGHEGSSQFWGGSFVCDAFGKTLVRAGSQEQVIVQEIDLAHNELVAEGWRFFANRRPESYGLLTERKK